jgi:penicillin-binding protein 2
MKRFRPGISFGDFVVADSRSKKSLINNETDRDYRRGWLIWVGVILGMTLLLVRLATLQLFYGDRYRLLADQNRIQKIKLPAQRGVIFDRNKEELVKNEKIITGTGKDERETWNRIYLLATTSAHVLGYVGEIGNDEVGLLKNLGSKYEAGDKIGRSGIEAEYEDLLRGIDGGRLVEVDNQGNISREMGRREAEPGRDLYLSLDKNILQTAQEALGNKKGAVVVSNPQTGEILALNSSPTFDPNTITTNYLQLNAQTDLPFLNRAIGGIYPPGSTFKMVTTTAAIESGKVKPEFTFNDQGIITVNGYSYTNWLFTKHGGMEGITGFSKAITRSTDTFFYTVGGMTGPELISIWARSFGLGELTGIDIPGEVIGIIPDPEWKMKTKNEAWFLGNTFQMAIGQGDILVTPIQINRMTNILATNGNNCKLHLMQAQSSKIKDQNNNQCPKVQISKQTLEIIKKGMIGACSPGGTAFPLFDWNESALNKSGSSSFAKASKDSSLPLVACKTGTAEYVAASGNVRTHGWLTAYAPADNPEISVTVLMEGGGEGSNVAAPVVRKILAKYFNVEDKYPYSAIPQEVGE